MESISRPATDMLAMVMTAIPNIFAAIVILAVSFYAARFIANLVGTILEGMNFDRIPAVLGIEQMFAGGIPPSKLVGKILIFFTMLFAVVEAANRLGFAQVSGLVGSFVELGGQIILGSVILGVGFWLANISYNTILKGGADNRIAAGIARFAILGLVTAMGLRAMGLADDIVNMAFGLILGAIAVAVALSFGLGGREAAGKQMEYWFKQMRGEPNSK